MNVKEISMQEEKKFRVYSSSSCSLLIRHFFDIFLGDLSALPGFAI